MCNCTAALLARLDPADVTRLQKGATAATKNEQKSQRELMREFRRLEDETIEALQKGLPPPTPDFAPLLLAMAYNAMKAGFDTEAPPIPKTASLAAKNNSVKIPKNPRELRIWWDMVRHGKAPKKIQALADKIKHAYIDKVQSIWDKVAEDFRAGKVWNEDGVRAVMRQAVAVPRARAATIVATENTRYFNTARINYYDQVETVTHYLFIAIRDHRTTAWCKTRQGLIYSKGTALFEHNRPPCHWNCRSEATPLSPFNPRHKALIEDKSLQAANNNPAPLPPGWSGRK